ncbi:hypothetical protein F511_19907 [Dorcoceras hygrometricum]|uniref:Uncharacterized protein n=1 Tax=Dorcoceras hygrometricum TaxID=472368 RepID=A0A2Z7CDK5_9LAMI|nr:hypothetical protein F511_19907 [Dorcoceras hygrometricum]
MRKIARGSARRRTQRRTNSAKKKPPQPSRHRRRLAGAAEDRRRRRHEENCARQRATPHARAHNQRCEACAASAHHRRSAAAQHHRTMTPTSGTAMRELHAQQRLAVAHHFASNGAKHPAGMCDKRACNHAAFAASARPGPSITRPARDGVAHNARRCASDAHAMHARRKRHFTVDCGRQRQSGPRPDTRLLRHPALEGVTRSARTDSPRRIGRKQFPARKAAAAA